MKMNTVISLLIREEYMKINKMFISFFKRYPHWKLLLYWPLYGIAFELLEWYIKPRVYNIMYSPIDDYIPFNEIFIIPYYYWFVALIGIHVYTFFKEPEVFKKLMRFIMFTQTFAVIIFAVYPSVQFLRPDVMPRDNIFTDLVSYIYTIDTNTNVCPSLHVIGGVAVLLAASKCKALQTTSWRCFFVISTLLICLSTVFLKQHSIQDMPVSILLCLLGYWVAYGKNSELLNSKIRRKFRTA